MKSYDVIVYGATGFTGGQAAAYLAEHPDRGELRLAVAGRNRDKLTALARRLPGDVGVVVADSTAPETVDAMVQMTRVVVSTAGPFALYGGPVVAACARFGVDYVDITGETPWIRRMIDAHHQEAAATGAKIVPCCGFDSVPSDLGALLIVDHIRRALDQPTREVKALFSARGGLNGGTLASAIGMAERGDTRKLGDPVLLNPAAHRTAEARRANPDQRGPAYDPDLKRWTAPFFMAPINTRIVRRSAALAADLDGAPYGEPFRYSEAMLTRGRLMATAITAASGLFFAGTRSELGRKLLKRLGPDPGEGPSEAAMDGGFFRTKLVGRAADGQRVDGVISDRGDPGNRATVKMLCESALCLALHREHLPGGEARGGVLTPASALGMRLADRLRAAGMRIEITG